MLLEKYAPNDSSEILGNKKQILEIKQWASSWKKGLGLILHGPSGVGKSLTARLVMKECGYDLIESCGEEQSKGFVYRLLSASRQRSIFGKKRAILINDADYSNKRNISLLIKESGAPVIITMDNPYTSNIKNSCSLVRFYRIRADTIEKFLRTICRKENIKYEDRALVQLARQSGGDVRAALIDLETAGTITLDRVRQIDYRDSVDSIFDTLKVMFNTSSISTALEALQQSEKLPEDVFYWVSENAQGRRTERIYELLSRADIARARILRRQSWVMQKHFITLTAAAAASTEEKIFRFNMPRYRRTSLEDAPVLHVSKRRLFLYSSVLDKLKKTSC